MRRSRNIVIYCLLLLAGCSQSPPPHNGLISAAGNYAPPGECWTIAVNTEGQYKITYPASHLAERHYWEPKPGWFLFIEDSKHLWTFDGASKLYVFVWTEDGSMGRYDLTSYHGTLPPLVLRALPGNIREQLKAHANIKT